MHDATRFTAPWGILLKGMTLFSVALLGGLTLSGLTLGPRDSIAWNLGMVVMPIALLAGGCCFVIRGYVLTRDALKVQRLGWHSTVSLAGLVSAEIDPQAMNRSIRLFGNGGLFCFAGLFSNKKLGSYRAWATDPKRSVVLRFQKRTVVVTPGNPADFVQALQSRIGR